MPLSREEYLARQADRHARRVCIRCGEHPAVAGRESCTACLDGVADRVRARQRDRRGSTRSVWCTACDRPGHNRRRHRGVVIA